MRTLRHLLCLFIAPLLLAGCLEGEEATHSPMQNFESLWSAVDQHYCFLDYKQKELGVDWQEVYQRYKGKINDKMGNYQLFEVLCDMLAELQDGHVNLYCSADIGRNWSWREDFPKNLDEEVKEAYLGKGTDYRITGGMKYRILSDNTGYVVCESFGYTLSEGGMNEIFHYLRACNGIILDVRGNSGGYLSSAEALASRFTNERRLVGYFNHKTGPWHQDFSTPQAEYLEPSKGVRWQKPCVVLTNRSCYSATNTFVRDMKVCPQVTILGDKTGGGSGMPFTYELPNSWILRLSACPMYDVDMNHIEFGIEPDIYCSLDPTDLEQNRDSMIEKARQFISGSTTSGQ